MHSTIPPILVPVVEVSNTTQSITIYTPQKKASYKNKNRWKLKPLKDAVLLETGCKNSKEIKKYLKILGVKLDVTTPSAALT